MRISGWSSDVCSSDLRLDVGRQPALQSSGGAMKAGRFDRHVRIEKRTMVDDDYNDVEKWDEWKTVPAQYIPSAGKEAREAMGQQATLPASFVMQYTPMLDDVLVKGPADYRLRFPPTDDGRVFDIKSAVEIGRSEEHTS